MTWGTAFDDLQDALADALARLGQNEVHEIWVAAGTYVPTTNPGDPTARFRIVPRASLYGGFAGVETSLGQRDPVANPTILSGDVLGDDGPNFANRTDNVRLLWANGQDIDNATITDGFIVKSGFTTLSQGAGLYVLAAGPKIRNCTFLDNWSTNGAGAIYLEFGVLQDVPRIEQCRFEGNKASSSSGAIGTTNMSGSFVSVIDCEFVSNLATGDAGAVGGSMMNVIRCRFVGNSARVGGALFIVQEGRVVDCVFRDNHCEDFGGALYTIGASPTSMMLGNLVHVANCLFYDNTTVRDGAAIYANDSRGIGPRITNCTIVGNVADRFGGGILLKDDANTPETWSRPLVSNCVVWGNSDPSGSGDSAQVHVLGAQVYPVVSGCDIQGWTGSLLERDGRTSRSLSGAPLFFGIATFSADPLFLDPLGPDLTAGTDDDDYRLRPGSPCIHRGLTNRLPLDVTDQDGDGNLLELLPLDLIGQPRVLGSAVDVGCYEAP